MARDGAAADAPPSGGVALLKVRAGVAADGAGAGAGRSDGGETSGAIAKAGGGEEERGSAGLVADNYFVFPNGRVYRCPLCEDFALHSLIFKNNRLVPAEKLNESDLFQLNIAEGCVMNKLIQPDNLSYDSNGQPEYKIACCLLKEEISND